MKFLSCICCGLVYLFFIFLFVLVLLIVKKVRIDGFIKVVVVMVMENCFFDYMLGWFKILNLEIDGLIGKECNFKNIFNFDLELVCVLNIVEFVDFDFGYLF